MNREINDVIVTARKRALNDVTIAPSKRFKITKNLETGKIHFQLKESGMETTQNNTNYLQYDTRTV